MISIISDNIFLNNKNLNNNIGKILSIIIDIFECSPLEIKELNTMEKRIEILEDQGAGSKFSSLIFAKPPNHNIAQNMGDPRKRLVEIIAKLCTQNNQFKQWLEKQIEDDKYKNAFNGYANKFGIGFGLQ